MKIWLRVDRRCLIIRVCECVAPQYNVQRLLRLFFFNAHRPEFKVISTVYQIWSGNRLSTFSFRSDTNCTALSAFCTKMSNESVGWECAVVLVAYRPASDRINGYYDTFFFFLLLVALVIVVAHVAPHLSNGAYFVVNRYFYRSIVADMRMRWSNHKFYSFGYFTIS